MSTDDVVELPGQVNSGAQQQSSPGNSNQSTTQRIPATQQPASRSSTTNRNGGSGRNSNPRNPNHRNTMPSVEAYIRQLAVTQRLEQLNKEQQHHHSSLSHYPSLYGTGSVGGSAHSSQYMQHPKKSSSSSLARPPRSVPRSATPANMNQPLLEDPSPGASPLQSPEATNIPSPIPLPCPRPPYSTSYPTTTDEYLAIVDEVREAIKIGMQPLRISQGSSGSYFCRNRAGEIVGVFKPKDEEPYGHLNPKWTKWLHRTCCPCMFGRSCLIPNLGYVSEAAASVVDRHLGLNIVPRTDIVTLSSPAFAYSKADRRRAREYGRELPQKIGSFQLFMHGYTSASVFMRDGPRWLHEGRMISDVTGKYMHPQLQSQFQQEFEKLVVIDYIIRNTDRSLDNWMIRVGEPSEMAVSNPGGQLPESPKSDTSKPLSNLSGTAADYLLIQSPPRLSIAAIDNGLAFPYKHPDKVRSYPYYWASLPSARVPFSPAIRKQILPMLTSSHWWKDLQTDLKRIFALDKDFDERLFRRQVAVVKGQVFHLVQVLSSGSSPLPEYSLGCPMDLILQPPCLVWENEDVRELAAGSLGVDMVRDGLLGTVIGGLDTQPNSTRASTAATVNMPVGGMGGSNMQIGPIVTINTGTGKPGANKTPSTANVVKPGTAGQSTSPYAKPGTAGQQSTSPPKTGPTGQIQPQTKPTASAQVLPKPESSEHSTIRRSSDFQQGQQSNQQLNNLPTSPTKLLGSNLKSTISLSSLPQKRAFVPLSSSPPGYFLVDPAKYQPGPIQIPFPESQHRQRTTSSSRRLDQIKQKWTAVGQELGMFKGRVITFVKQQPWFSNW